jgi:hypothetical protein
MPALRRDAQFVPPPDVRYRAMPSGGMLVDLVTGACFELNRVGADLWTRLADGDSVGAAVEAVRHRYEVAADIIERDALRLCAELLDAGLLKRESTRETR